MHRRPSAAATPLAVVTLPPRQRDLASLRSPDSAPHTPTKRAEPLPLFSTTTNRYSTDSWNSSNCDGADEIVFEWKPEQLLMLTRTLDALPSHLLTPFNGPVPPSNLLDKLARGVAKAKNPVEWPHSMRATRAKIVELARQRAADSRDESASDTIVEEESDSSDVPLQQTTNISYKRTLYKQSSMDFMQPPKLDIKDNANISRLSRRLQRTDRMLLSPTYDLYERSTPLNPSTPSSTTLNSTLSPRPSRMLRRSISSMSNDSEEFVAPINPNLRRLRRSDTFAGSTLFPVGLKRAPSYGGSSRNSCNSLESVAMSIDFNARDSDVTSDEEERLRNRKTKRARKRASSPTPTSPPVSPPVLSSPSPVTRSKVKSKSTTNNAGAGIGENGEKKRAPKRKSAFTRHPSILGPELPNPQHTPQSPAPVLAARTANMPKHSATPTSPAYNMTPASPYNITHIPPVSPQSPRTLRRSRPIAPLPRAALARKISFSNLAAPAGDGAGTGAGLGSAFQLH